MLLDTPETLARFLQDIADELDIPDHAYEEATLKYEEIGEYLASDDSELRKHNPQIYPQGSFRLGTVVQPIGRQGEYDIDLVCMLDINKESITQEELKDKVGDRLITRDDLKEIIKSSRRCWTLKYPQQDGMPSFHMDVLPSIPNQDRLPTGILLTDTELTRWQKSNPIAYAEWFKKRMEVVFTKRRRIAAEALSESVEQVPEWRIKTPLQRSIQILKRHRDIHFQKKPDLRPVSIIITTLAAKAYRNQDDIFDALIDITKDMPVFIENRNGKWWVQNPVDDGENFADKWNEYPERREAFIAWLKKVESDVTNISRTRTIDEGLVIAQESLGSGIGTNNIKNSLGISTIGSPLNKAPLVPILGDTQHVKKPQWPIHETENYHINITASVYSKNKHGNPKKLLWPLTKDKTVPKNIFINFKTNTNVPEPYLIQWQVANTGQEAVNARQLRGDFYKSDEEKGVRWESTTYRGTHWVEAFVIKSGICVARSGKIMVRVR
ncbi:nucleotidyltransferase [Methylomagnum ishizawai]|uniref:nucleotidyltransferase n=1 Tax=Methylomagnum ishizawai TaxID=1760988 RepID=UPI001C333FFF|nr:nucleotidyltransferase [Methylomagnum ishizawai]BBL77516.1 hypothetical protein MishRS11D_46140 [Methylomagnum ishizawai]